MTLEVVGTIQKINALVCLIVQACSSFRKVIMTHNLWPIWWLSICYIVKKRNMLTWQTYSLYVKVKRSFVLTFKGLNTDYQMVLGHGQQYIKMHSWKLLKWMEKMSFKDFSPPLPINFSLFHNSFYAIGIFSFDPIDY